MSSNISALALPCVALPSWTVLLKQRLVIGDNVARWCLLGLRLPRALVWPPCGLPPASSLETDRLPKSRGLLHTRNCQISSIGACSASNFVAVVAHRSPNGIRCDPVSRSVEPGGAVNSSAACSIASASSALAGSIRQPSKLRGRSFMPCIRSSARCFIRDAGNVDSSSRLRCSSRSCGLREDRYHCGLAIPTADGADVSSSWFSNRGIGGPLSTGVVPPANFQTAITQETNVIRAVHCPTHTGRQY